MRLKNILDSERSEETIVVLQWCFFLFFILYTKLKPERELRFQHTCTLHFSELDQDATLERSCFDFLNSYLMPREKPQTNYEKWDFNF